MSDVTNKILALDGFAAVNLAEPSPGDLERIYDAYKETFDQLNINQEALDLAVYALKQFSYRYSDGVYTIPNEAENCIIEINRLLKKEEPPKSGAV